MARDRAARGRFRAAMSGALIAVAFAVSVAGCSAASTGPGPGTSSSPSSQLSQPTGTATHPSTVAQSPSTVTMSEQPTTVVTTPTEPTLIAPPPTTSEPPAAPGTCPYLTDQQVEDANGQHTGVTSVIRVEPYPVCVFTRSSGGFLAATRIVRAATPEQAAAAVNEHVPIGESYPVTHPAGWTGGAMSTPHGLPGYPDAGSIYAVSKGTIAIIAISNQKQSIKGRQMVTDIVANLGL